MNILQTVSSQCISSGQTISLKPENSLNAAIPTYYLINHSREPLIRIEGPTISTSIEEGKRVDQVACGLGKRVIGPRG